jgi:hypothetical protein
MSARAILASKGVHDLIPVFLDDPHIVSANGYDSKKKPVPNRHLSTLGVHLRPTADEPIQRHLIFERSTRILCAQLRTLLCHFRTATVSLPQSEAQAPDTRNTILYSEQIPPTRRYLPATRWSLHLHRLASLSSSYIRSIGEARPCTGINRLTDPQADYPTRHRSDSPASITNFPAPFELTRICASFSITAFACCKDSARYVLVNPTTFIPPARAD